MLDRFNREINYLRISVTDRCNLRCVYCMPADGIPLKQHKDFLTFEQIYSVVKEAAKIGFNKIRLTGGEPLVKRDIEKLVEMIASVEGIKTIGMTTNGILLPQKAKLLKEAGLSSLNISCDTLNPERYKKITRIGELDWVLKGIDAALKENFPIKINMVVTNETTEKEIEEMQKFCDDKNMKLQLINHYDLTSEKLNNYTFDRPPNCAFCNRIRLLADGTLKPCLHSNIEVKVDFNNIRQSLIKAIKLKPESGYVCTNRAMYEIGG